MFFIFIITLLLYLVACGYLCWRVCRTFHSRVARYIVVSSFVLLSLLFFISKLISGGAPLWVNKIVYIVGTGWLVFVLYGILLLTVTDIAKLLSRRTLDEKRHTSLSQLAMIAVLDAMILFVGYEQAITPSVTTYHMGDKDMPRIAVVSDLHLGYAVGESDVQCLVDKLEELEPDILIIAGDLLDGDIAPVVAWDLGEPLRDYKPKMGKYSVMGNHDYMSNPDVAKNYAQSLGIELLCDTFVTVGRYSIVGRDDLTSMWRRGKRTELKNLVSNDTSRIIVVDHQPLRTLAEYERDSVFLYISGHTHGGQVWPINMLTRMVYEMDYGMCKIGEGDHYAIVTSGYGTWGPRVRLGTKSEIVIIE